MWDDCSINKSCVDRGRIFASICAQWAPQVRISQEMGNGIGIREAVPEKEPPRTTTTCLFAGARGDVDVLGALKCNVAGGSLEWRSIGEGRIKSIAGNTFTDILIRESTLMIQLLIQISIRYKVLV